MNQQFIEKMREGSQLHMEAINCIWRVLVVGQGALCGSVEIDDDRLCFHRSNGTFKSGFMVILAELPLERATLVKCKTYYQTLVL